MSRSSPYLPPSLHPSSLPSSRIGADLSLSERNRFCVTTISATDSSFVKCYDAAKAIMSTVYELSGSSFEIGLLASFLNWSVSLSYLPLMSRRS